MGVVHDGREAKLRLLLGRLKNGQVVQNRDLRKALGDDAYAGYEHEWQYQLELREQLKDKPQKIREYEAKLQAAIFAYSKADAASRQGRKRAAHSGMRAAEAAFEKLHEFASETVEQDHGLAIWFDRDVRQTATSLNSLCPEGAARVFTSKSLDRRGGGFAAAIRSKRDVKIAAIERELATLDEDEGSDEGKKAAIAARIEKVLNRVRLGKR